MNTDDEAVKVAHLVSYCLEQGFYIIKLQGPDVQN